MEEKEGRVQSAHENGAFGECSVNYSSGFNSLSTRSSSLWVVFGELDASCVSCRESNSTPLDSARPISRKIESRFLGRGEESFLKRLGEPKFKVCILSSYMHIGTGKRTMDYNLNMMNKILLYRQRLYCVLVTGSSKKKIKDFFIFLFFSAMSHSYIIYVI